MGVGVGAFFIALTVREGRLEGMLEGAFARVTVLLAGAVGGASGAGLLFQ